MWLDVDMETRRMLYKWSAVTFCYLILVTHIQVTDAQGGGGTQNNTAVTFLQQFGYIEKNVNTRARGAPPVDLPAAIRGFQSFVGLPVTGTLDELTVQKMQEPRCGNSDITVTVTDKRRKRYVHNGSKWPRSELTYQLKRSQTTSRLPAQTLDGILRQAFDMWSAVANLKFVDQRRGHADIILLFGRRDHGDSYPFDGYGHTLAHAFSPRSGGDVHFDDDEPWSTSFSNGRSLLAVAVHEIGHSLGLSHSRTSSAVMAPYYRSYRPGTFRLHTDDIQGAQSLYGPPAKPSTSTTTTTTKTTPTTTTSKTPETTTWRPWRPTPTTYVPWRPTTASPSSCWWCWWTPRPRPPPVLTTRFPPWFGVSAALITNPTVTTTTTTIPPTTPTTTTTTSATTRATRNPNSELTEACRFSDIDAIMSPPGSLYVYAFKGNRFMKLREEGAAGSYPLYTNLNFGGLSQVDAAMTVTEGADPPIIYLFTGSWVIKFHLNLTQIGGYKWISQEFPGFYSGRVDAAVQWSVNNRIYLFVGNVYYKIGRDRRVLRGYPKMISIWGLPQHVTSISAVTNWSVDNELYFFVGGRYYKYDRQLSRLAIAPSGERYPRSTAKWWFGCNTPTRDL